MTIDTIGSASTPRPTERAAASEPTPAGGASRAPAARVETAAAVKAPDALPSEQQVSDALSKLNKAPQTQANNLEFSVDQDTKRTVVKVIDQNTKEVVRQFPTKEALAIAKALDEQQDKGSPGLLIDHTA